jgi:signal recognition particle subunit SRP19
LIILTKHFHVTKEELKESDEKVRYPKRPYVRSGYIVIPKESSKTKILNKISEKLVAKRAKQTK